MELPNIPKVATYIGAILFFVTTAFAANSYVAKEKDLAAVRVDVAMLGKAFQYDQKENQISAKEDRIYKINDRLQQRITTEERKQLEQIKRDLEIDIHKLKEDQKKLK